MEKMTFYEFINIVRPYNCLKAGLVTKDALKDFSIVELKLAMKQGQRLPRRALKKVLTKPSSSS